MRKPNGKQHWSEGFSLPPHWLTRNSCRSEIRSSRTKIPPKSSSSPAAFRFQKPLHAGSKRWNGNEQPPVHLPVNTLNWGCDFLPNTVSIVWLEVFASRNDPTMASMTLRATANTFPSPSRLFSEPLKFFVTVMVRFFGNAQTINHERNTAPVVLGSPDSVMLGFHVLKDLAVRERTAACFVSVATCRCQYSHHWLTHCARLRCARAAKLPLLT